MDTTWQTILAVCGGIAALGGATAAIKRWLEPAKKVLDRVRTLEEHERNDIAAIKAIQDDNKDLHEVLTLLLKTQLALLDHGITNNSTGKMAAIRKEVTDYLVLKK